MQDKKQIAKIYIGNLWRNNYANIAGQLASRICN